MTTILVTDHGKKQEMTIPDQQLMVLVHQQGIRVDVPEAELIDSRKTLKCMEEMSQKAWVHISTGPLFREVVARMFRGQDIFIPDTIQEVNEGDLGVAHAYGLIVLACEARFAGKKKLFFRNPEDLLHPRTQQTLVDAINLIASLPFGDNGEKMQAIPV